MIFMLASSHLYMIFFWFKLIIPIFLIIVPVWLGKRIGIRVRERSGHINHTPVGTVVGAGLGLFAFMLAFTFQIASSRYDTRKQLLLNETESIRSTYMKAGLLPDKYRIPSRQLITEYLDLRVKVARNPSFLEEAKVRTTQIQHLLWTIAQALTKEFRNSEVYTLYITSTNELIELYNKRIVIAQQYHIHDVILWVLYFISFSVCDANPFFPYISYSKLFEQV